MNGLFADHIAVPAGDDDFDVFLAVRYALAGEARFEGGAGALSI